ncbi:hypothetical protein JXI42_01840 [bacterium]|nr:hypothetical protein [bacterium]
MTSSLNPGKAISMLISFTLIALLSICIFCSNGTDDDDNGNGGNGPDTTDYDTLTHPPDSFGVGNLSYLGSFLQVNNSGRNIEFSNNYLFIPQMGGFLIASAINPSEPDSVGTFYTTNIRYGIAIEVEGDYAYLLGWDWTSNAYFYIVDITEPNTPQTISSTEITGQGSGVATYGDYAYIAGAENGVYVFDISNRSDPVQVAVIPVSKAYRLFSYNHYLLISSDTENHGGWQYDISNPASPEEVFHFFTPGYTRSIFAKYNHLFVADGVYRYTSVGSFQIFSIDEPATPLASDTLSNSVHGVYVEENFAYVVDWVSSTANLTVYDIYKPSRPNRIFAPYALDIAKDVVANGNYIYVLGRNDIHVFMHDY